MNQKPTKEILHTHQVVSFSNSACLTSKPFWATWKPISLHTFIPEIEHQTKSTKSWSLGAWWFPEVEVPPSPSQTPGCLSFCLISSGFGSQGLQMSDHILEARHGSYGLPESTTFPEAWPYPSLSGTTHDNSLHLATLSKRRAEKVIFDHQNDTPPGLPIPRPPSFHLQLWDLLVA